jgi:hypothetical protein
MKKSRKDDSPEGNERTRKIWSHQYTREQKETERRGGGGSESLCSRQAGAGGGALLAALCGLDTLKPSSQFSIKYRHTTHIAVRPLLTTPASHGTRCVVQHSPVGKDVLQHNGVGKDVLEKNGVGKMD